MGEGPEGHSRCRSRDNAVGDSIPKRQGARWPRPDRPGPVRIGPAYRRSRPRIGVESQCHKRWRAPPFRTTKTGNRPPELPQPGHRGAREGSGIIPRSGDNRNRHQLRDRTPVPPLVELGQIIGAHQPDESPLWIAPQQCAEGVGRVAGPQFALDRGDPDSRTAGLPLRRGDPRREGRHARCRLERITRRHQPPDLVERQRVHREKRNASVPAVRGVEAAAEQPDGRAAAPPRGHGFQGRVWPLPRTCHL
jgi:hypothetical protein